MTTSESRSCGLSRDVTLAVLPRLHLEEVVLELERRNIHCGPDSNNKELLTNVLQEVMKQEYYTINCQWSDQENPEPSVPNMGSPHSWAVSEEVIETAHAHNTTNILDTVTTNDLDNKTINDLDNGTTNDLDNDTNNDLDNGTTNDLDNDAKNDLDNGTTNDLDNGNTNDLDNEVHAPLSAADALPSIPPTTAIQQASKPKSKPSTTKRRTQQTNIQGDILDTADVAKNIRKILHMNDLQQKCFGKHVLRRLPGIVADLLNHPKPWEKLKPITRQLYRTMRDWMSPEKLIHNILDLKKLQREDTYICEKSQAPTTDNSTNIEEAKDTSENTIVTEEMEQNHKEHSPEVTYNNTAQVRETHAVDEHAPSYSLANTVYITPTLSYTTQDSQNQKEMAVSVLDDTADVLNPAQIANALRDTLVEKRLTQAMFSRLVLQRGQGTFSMLLNNPRPWDKMHPRKQKLYKTMKQWMEPDVLDHNVQELRTAWKNYKMNDHKLKRKRQEKSTHKSKHASHSKAPSENQTALEAILTPEDSKIQDSLASQDAEAPSSSPHTQDPIMSEATPLVNDASERPTGTACTNQDQPFSDCVRPHKVALKLKQILKANKISYQMFARKVLRRSPGSLADLLNYPLAWHKMRPPRQKLYRTMWEWMSPCVVQKNIKELAKLRKNQASKAKKTKRATEELQGEEEFSSAAETSQCTSEHALVKTTHYVVEPQDGDSIPSNIQTDSQPESSTQRKSTPCVVTSLDYTDIGQLVRQLRSTLRKHDVSQQIFARKVLGRSPSTLAEMLNYPRPWSKLTPRKKQLYTVLHQWMASPNLQNNIERLKAEENKQLKREPTRFTKSQQKALQDVFSRTKYPTEPEIASLAEEQALSERAVSTWFQNRRSRYKIKYRNTREPSETKKLINTDT